MTLYHYQIECMKGGIDDGYSNDGDVVRVVDVDRLVLPVLRLFYRGIN